MTTIKTTIKKEIGKINLPKDVTLRIEPEGIRIYLYPEIDRFFKTIDILREIKKVLSNYQSTILDNYTLRMQDHNINIQSREWRNFNTICFYEEVEEEIEITSYEQGCNVLKDIFHK